ncbi:hypothetical protein BU23DRAFT_61727 [Bimuria novae-zelandiae CBS 107.79]|uniref:Uncharacterized protein n=1 Tax=Bimuria novae-zelandiae CBS 107.79 TaxID=1447943 RepID=A0A6A5UHZ7_9PLEO|nr:hypothetical protein BU23DRAFT_61727 [Bimuria novae-zelandiae CBS 107.79]
MAHLFVLPREIRDIIYSYVDEPGSCFLWPYPIDTRLHQWSGVQSINIECDRVPVEKAIIPGCQATEEYLRAFWASGSRDSQITVRLHIDYRTDQDPVVQASETCGRKNISAIVGRELLKSTKHLRLLIQVSQFLDQPQEIDLVEKIGHNLIQGFMTLMSHPKGAASTYKTIKVGIDLTSPTGYWTHATNHDTARYYFNPYINHFPVLAPGSTLVQDAESYRLKLLRLDEEQVNPCIPIPDFRLVKTVALLYALGGICEVDRYWTEEEVLEAFPSRSIPRSMYFHEYSELESRIRRWSDKSVTRYGAGY